MDRPSTTEVGVSPRRWFDDGSGLAAADGEERFRLLAEVMAQIVCVLAPDGTPRYVNPAWTAFSGLDREATARAGWPGIVHPDDVAKVVDCRRRALAALAPQDVELRYRGADGSYRWFASRLAPVVVGGRVVQFVGSAMDIEDRRRAELELRAQKEEAQRRAAELEAVLDAVPAAVLITRDPEGRAVVGNRFWAQGLAKARGRSLFSSADGEAPPRLRMERYGRELAPVEQPVPLAARTGQDQLDVEFDLLFEDGTVRHMFGHARALLDAEGGHAGAVGAFLDITEHQRAEEALRRSNEQLRAAKEEARDSDRRKSEFLGVLSHELRNPLAPIRNCVYLLERLPPNGEQAAHARAVIRRQTEHLARLVDDLLDVTRISRGKISLDKVRIDLRDVVRRTVDDLRSLFVKAGLELEVGWPPKAIGVEVDPTRISQVLGNLLNNAAKFTPRGGAVKVEAGVARGRAELRVRDTGVGMDPATIERMFEPFTQGPRTLARTAGGLGLGLSLVKALVELHGGAVRATSEGPGRGAEFVVELPLAEIASELGRDAGAAEARPLAIVVIEDNVDAGDTLADVLALSGHRVRVARDATSGVALAREAPPDVIVCDIGLPDMSGYEVARLVRRDPRLVQTRLVALSGYARPEDQARAAAAGFDAQLPKPASFEQLEATLRSGGGAAAPPAA